MTLGIFLPVGDSFKNMAQSGQDARFKKFYLPVFAKNFDQVFIFSYENERVSQLPKNVRIVPNKYNLHRFFYAALLPFLNLKTILKCDVLRAYHLFGTPPAIIAKIFFAKPFIFNYAYDYFAVAKLEGKKFQVFLYAIIKPLAFLFSSKIFAATKSILRSIPKQKAIYLPNGVDTNFFKPAKVRKISKRPRILSVGRLEKQKNFEILIKALSGMDVDLTIVGNGSLRNKLQNLAKKQKVNLKIISNVPNTQMPKIYNQADIFVMSSLAEGSPKALLEAMACGLPVIGTTIEGVNDVIVDGQNGFLAETNSSDISRKIRILLSDKGLENKLAREARGTILSDFNLSNLMKKEIDSLSKL